MTRIRRLNLAQFLRYGPLLTFEPFSLFYSMVSDIPRALCVIVGIGWLFVLPLDEFSRRSYISENALLPGQVETYFGGSELNIINAYRAEVESWASAESPDL
jgi:hypothetical protein